MKEKEIKKEIKKSNQLTEDEKARIHFMKVCKHGVPDGYYCQSDKKIIKIPEDAVIKE